MLKVMYKSEKNVLRKLHAKVIILYYLVLTIR